MLEEKAKGRTVEQELEGRAAGETSREALQGKVRGRGMCAKVATATFAYVILCDLVDLCLFDRLPCPQRKATGKRQRKSYTDELEGRAEGRAREELTRRATGKS